MNKLLFSFLLPKIYEVSIISTSLILYIKLLQKKSRYQRRFCALTLIFSILTSVLLQSCLFITKYQTQQHIIYALLILFTSTKMGFDILSAPKQTNTSIVSLLSMYTLPNCIIFDQGVHIQSFLLKYTKVLLETVTYFMWLC